MSQENDLTVQAAILEALLFSSEEPLTTAKIREIAEELQEADIKGVTEHLNQKYDDTGRSFRIQMVAGGYQIFTLPDYAEYIEKLYAKRQQQRLSAKALETLAIIAYKQPITRPEIEDIRGVNVDGVLRTLLSRKLITISGTANAPGTPFLYKTTRLFLEYFGLKSLKDLPKLKELDEILEADSELQERMGPEYFKEMAPELLGLERSDEVDEQDEEESPE